MTERNAFEKLIAASSLGTPSAKRHIKRAADEWGIAGAQRRIDEAAAYEAGERTEDDHVPCVDCPGKWSLMCCGHEVDA